MKRSINGRRSLKAGADAAGSRLDSHIAEKLSISRSRAQKLIDGGHVTVNGKQEQKSYEMHAGDIIEACIPPDRPPETKPEQIPLRVIYEDEDMIVLSKPAGMVVHPAPGHSSGTLVNALLAHAKGLSSVGGVDRPGIVHRLDKDTSGLIIAAKTDRAHRKLSDDLKNRRIKKTYLALVRGEIKGEEGVISEPIGRHSRDRKKMAAGGIEGREATTRWRVLARHKGYTLLEVSPETGRTHQIRVHLSHAGHPVVGDPVYGKDPAAAARAGLKRQFLHAARLELSHPVTGERMSFSDELPSDLKEALETVSS